MTTATPDVPVHLQRTKFEPGPDLVRLGEESPVSRITFPWGTQGWLITRYREARDMLGDTTHFSNVSPARDDPGRLPRSHDDRASEHNNVESAALDNAGFLIGMDPPEHTRLRKLLTGAFTMARMRHLRPRIEAIVTEHLDAMAATGGPVDLVEAFALPVPSLVICELLGVPYAERNEFQRFSHRRLDLSLDFDDRVAAAAETRAFLATVVARQRANPGEDLTGMLIREHGSGMSDAELIGVSDLLLLAGHETTANMLGLGTLLLLRNPDQIDVLRQPEHTEGAIEELLRYLSIVHTVVPRTAVADVELGGQHIRAGEPVLVSLPLANRDPAQGAELDRFDLTRAITSHVAFGHGVHHCIGAPLARMELRIAYPALFDRFPTLRLAVPFEQVPFRAFNFVYGVEALPVTW